MKNRIDGDQASGRLTGRLTLRGDRLAKLRVDHAIARLVARATPKGIRAEALLDGIRLSGRGLKRRMILDPELRRWPR